jgi:multidrug resistance efflux pump
MSPDYLRVILQSAAAVLLGGGGLQLILFLLRRRSELRKLDTSANVDQSQVSINQNTIYQNMVDQLQEDGAVYREQLKELRAGFERLQAQRLRDEQSASDSLRVAHAENTRLTTRVSQLTSDLDIANGQIERLRDELRRRRDV